MAEVVQLGSFTCRFLGQLFANVLEDLCGITCSTVKQKLHSLGTMATPLTEALPRLERVARAVCHVVNVTPDNPDCQPKAADVQFLMGYAGREPLERQWRIWLTGTSDWWTQEMQNINKISGKSILLQPKVEQLQALLNDASEKGWSTEEMRHAGELYAGGHLLEILQEAAGKLLEPAQGTKPKSKLSTPLVDAVLSGLHLFAAQPGVLSMMQQIREMATAKSADIAGSDLCRLMQQAMESMTEDLEDFGVVLTLVKQCALPDDCDEEVAEKFLFILMRSVCNKVGLSPIFWQP